MENTGSATKLQTERRWEGVVNLVKQVVERVAKTKLVGRRPLFGTGSSLSSFQCQCRQRCQVSLVLVFSLLLSTLLLIQTNGAFWLGGAENPGNGTAIIVACWLLVLAGIAGTLLLGYGISWGWLILLGLQPLWVAYAIATDQHGLIPGALAYGAVQLNGFVRGRSSSQQKASCAVNRPQTTELSS